MSISTEELMDIAKRNAVNYGNYNYEKLGKFIIHPHISIFKVPQNWNADVIKLMLNRLNCELSFPLTGIATVPSIENIGYLEIGLMDEDFHILQIAKNASNINSIIQDVIKIYHRGNDASTIQNYVYNELNLLVRKGVIIRV